MPAPAELNFRAARADDASSVARLQADSWQRHYRDAYTDFFLDEEVPGLFLERWAGRLAAPDPQARMILAERGGTGGTDGSAGVSEIVGMAYTILHDDPDWGALLYNLHVSHGLKRQRVGSTLMALTAQAVLADDASSGLYLWVLEQNTAARAFYQARGGACVERELAGAPEGDRSRLRDTPANLRIAWPDPSVLLAAE
jgi:ribosomal protein S18 acetylase RimI-like enzyme